MAKAMVLHCSAPLLTSHYRTLFRDRSRTLLNQKKCKLKPKTIVCEYSTSTYTNSDGRKELCRRDLLLFGLSSSLSAVVFPYSGLLAVEDAKMASFVDDINAYTYSYPMELASKKLLFKWVESRKPERYSSAAPLSPNARLRIVSERVDIFDNLIISVTVTTHKPKFFLYAYFLSYYDFISLIQIDPPNYEFIKSKDTNTWSAKGVADSVLSDKSALFDTHAKSFHLEASPFKSAYGREFSS